MSFATSNRTSISYCEETVTFGVADTSPVFQLLRYTGETVNHSISNIVSDEIRADRATSDLVQVDATNGGDVSFEMSAAAFDDLIEAAMCGTWATDTVKNGTVLRSFTVQKYLADADTPTYFNFYGNRVGTLSLSFDTGAILTGSIGFLGTTSSASESGLAGQTELPVPTKDVMNSVGNIVEIKIDGSDVSNTIFFNSLSMNLDNGLRSQMAIGKLGPAGIALSRLTVGGSISLYFADKSEYDKYVTGTALSLSFKVQDLAGNSYDFIFPKIKFQAANITSTGLDTDVFMEAEWTAIYDTTADCMIQIDRVAV